VQRAPGFFLVKIKLSTIVDRSINYVNIKFSPALYYSFLKGFAMSDLVQRLKEAVELVDSAVFPENPLPVVIVSSPQLPGHPQFALVRDTGGNRNLAYVVYSHGIDEYFQESRARNLRSIEIAKTHNLFAILGPDDIGLQEIMPYDESETILAAAFHEVRHRVQFELGIELINEGHTNQIERCRRWGQAQAKHYKNDPDGAIEFDAKFFECYGAFELRKGHLQTTPKQLKDFLFMTPYWLIKKEKKRKVK